MRELLIAAAALLGCKGDPAPAGGTASCPELMTCYGKCPGLTAECTGACDRTGTPAATAANTEVFRCIAQSACQDTDCMASACAAQLEACKGAAAAPAAHAAASSLPAVPDSDFVRRGANGLEYAPETKIVTQGVPVSLEGVWQDSRRNFSLELRGTTYTASVQSGGAHSTEAGTWTLEGTTFNVTPTSSKLDAINGMHQETDALAPDPPRAWTLVGALLEYVNMNDASGTVHYVDGVVLSGPPPSWDNVGGFSYTLRRAQ